MRLRASASGGLRFGRAARPGSLVFVGIGLLVIAAAAALAGRHTTKLSVIGLAGLFALSFAVLAGASRRYRSVRIEGDVVRVGSKRIPLTQSAKLVLGGRVGDVERLRPAYSIFLAIDGRDIKLLEDSDPATVLMDLRAVLGRLALSVQPGWGLGQDDIQPRHVEAGRGRGPVAPITFVGGAGPGYREAGLTVVITGVLIGLFLGRLVVERLAVGTPATEISIWVPTLLLLGVVITGLLALTTRTVVSLDSEFVWRQSALGITFARFSAPLDSVVGIHAVGPSPDRVLHVLIDLGDRALSLPCPDADADERARALRSALRARREPRTDHGSH